MRRQQSSLMTLSLIYYYDYISRGDLHIYKNRLEIDCETHNKRTSHTLCTSLDTSFLYASNPDSSTIIEKLTIIIELITLFKMQHNMYIHDCMDVSKCMQSHQQVQDIQLQLE